MRRVCPFKVYNKYYVCFAQARLSQYGALEAVVAKSIEHWPSQQSGQGLNAAGHEILFKSQIGSHGMENYIIALPQLKMTEILLIGQI